MPYKPATLNGKPYTAGAVAVRFRVRLFVSWARRLDSTVWINADRLGMRF